MKHGYRAGIAFILIIALFLRLYYVLNAEYAPLEWDQLEYTKTAIQLLENGIYAYRDTVPNTLVTPGWPIVLAAVYGLVGYEPLEPALMAVRVLQCFIALGAIWFIYRIGERLFHPMTGLIAALFAAVHPSYVWSTSLILTEVLFLTCFTAMLYMQVRIMQVNQLKDHILMGLLLAVCVLIRPNALPLAIVPYLFIWMKQKRIELKPALFAAGAFALVMMPWWVRNWLTFHELIFVAKGEAGNPFLGGTDPYFQGTIDWSKINEKEQFTEGLRRIKQGLAEDPTLWIKWMTVGKFIVFFKTLWVGPYPFSVPHIYYQIIYKLHFYLVYLGWLTLAAFSFRNRSLRYLAVCLVLFLGVHILFIPVDRYIYAMLPFLMLAAAYFLTSSLTLVWNGVVISLLERKRI